MTELDSSTREKTTRKHSELYKNNLCTYLAQQNIFRAIILFQSGWSIWINWFIARLSLFRGPITEINQSQSLSIGSGIVPNDPARPLVKIFWLLYGLPFWENLPSHKTFLFSFFQLFSPSVLFKIRLEYTPSRLSNRIARFEFEMFFFQSVILVVFWFETFLVLK